MRHELYYRGNFLGIAVVSINEGIYYINSAAGKAVKQ